MALAVEWLPEEWPDGIPNLKQLLVVAPLTTSILLLLAPEITIHRRVSFAHFASLIILRDRTGQADFFFRFRSRALLSTPAVIREHDSCSEPSHRDRYALFLHFLGKLYLCLSDIVCEGQIDQSLNVRRAFHLLLVLQQNGDLRST